MIVKIKLAEKQTITITFQCLAFFIVNFDRKMSQQLTYCGKNYIFFIVVSVSEIIFVQLTYCNSDGNNKCIITIDFIKQQHYSNHTFFNLTHTSHKRPCEGRRKGGGQVGPAHPRSLISNNLQYSFPTLNF